MKRVRLIGGPYDGEAAEWDEQDEDHGPIPWELTFPAFGASGLGMHTAVYKRRDGEGDDGEVTFVCTVP